MLKVSESWLVLAVVVFYGSLFGETVSQAEMKKINEYLINNYESDDIGGNMRALAALYKKESKVSKLNPFKSFQLTLKQLISLEKINCDAETMATLKIVNAALDDLPRNLNKAPVRRIDKLVRNLSLQHAKECQSGYISAYETKAASLDQEKVGHANIFGRRIFLDALSKEAPDVLSLAPEFDYKIDHYVNWHYQGLNVYYTLEDSLQGNRQLKYLRPVADELKGTDVVDEGRLKKLYQNYLIEPCRYLVGELSQEVFTPASYDSKLFHKVDKSKPNFYRAWYNFALCENLLNREDVVLRSFIEIARRAIVSGDEVLFPANM